MSQGETGKSASASTVADTTALQPVAAAMPIARALDRLGEMSRAGKLPGYERIEAAPPSGQSEARTVCLCDAFGKPFDSTITLWTKAAASDATCTLEPKLALKPGMPIVMIVVTILSIWPGVWLTDSMLRTYFDWYRFATWMWYLPLTILPLPWMVISMLRSSRASARASAAETLERIRAVLGA